MSQVLQSALGSVGDMQLYETQEAVKEPKGCTITTVVVPEVRARAQDKQSARRAPPSG